MTGRSARVAPIAVAVAIGTAIALTVIVTGCEPPPASPSGGAPATGSLAPPATAEGPPGSSGGASASPAGGVPVDPGLLAVVPIDVDGIPVTFDAETSATLAADPAVARDAAGLAVGLAIVAGTSAAEDLAIVNVVRLREPASGDEWFRDWRDTYDEAACGQAGGVIGAMETELGGGTVFIGSCAGGVRTYHALLPSAGLVVSVTSLGERRLGEKVMAGLKR